MKRSVIVRALKVSRPSWTKAEYKITARGGFISLKYFGPREVRGGVNARVQGGPSYFPGAFMTSGKRPNRFKVAKLNGHVFQNVAGGAWRGKMSKVVSQVRIPDGLERAAAKINFERQVEDRLSKRIDHEIGRLLDRL